MASIYRARKGCWTVQWSAGQDRKGNTIRDSWIFNSEQVAIAHKQAIERRQVGTGKESLSARGLHWIDDRLAVGSIGKKTVIGYREKANAWGRLIGDALY
jgi:hypothetical protein